MRQGVDWGMLSPSTLLVFSCLCFLWSQQWSGKQEARGREWVWSPAGFKPCKAFSNHNTPFLMNFNLVIVFLLFWTYTPLMTSTDWVLVPWLMSPMLRMGPSRSAWSPTWSKFGSLKSLTCGDWNSLGRNKSHGKTISKWKGSPLI